MSAAAELCGHRWRATYCQVLGIDGHRCDLPANHADPCPCPDGTCTVICKQPPVHTCRCGATTAKEPR